MGLYENAPMNVIPGSQYPRPSEDDQVSLFPQIRTETYLYRQVSLMVERKFVIAYRGGDEIKRGDCNHS
jgi:hypothetical protein